MADGLTEVRFHGRGGQGAWTASLLLAQAGLKETRFIQSFPAFGPERAGAPITAFTRISDSPIFIHSSVYEPDVVVVLDPTLLGQTVIQGLKKDTLMVVNTEHSPGEIREQLGIPDTKVWTIDATSLALEILKRPITNTAMLGAVIKATGLVKLESLLEAASVRFTGSIREPNLKLIRAAYEEVVEG